MVIALNKQGADSKTPHPVAQAVAQGAHAQQTRPVHRETQAALSHRPSHAPPVKTPPNLVPKGRATQNSHIVKLNAKPVAKGVTAEARELEVARVLFAETLETLKPDPQTGIPNKKDLQLVAYSIRNRVEHPGFTEIKDKKFEMFKDVYAVVMQDGAFSSRGSPLYNLAKKPAKLDSGQKVAWEECKKMAHEILKRDFKTPDHPKVVYFHDKSISKPENWDNKYWKAPKLVETNKFIYYGVAPVEAKANPRPSARNRG